MKLHNVPILKNVVMRNGLPVEPGASPAPGKTQFGREILMDVMGKFGQSTADW